MSRRVFPINPWLPAALLLISLGIDLHGAIHAAVPEKSALPLPGPRRYPPAYRAGSLGPGAQPAPSRITGP